MKLTEAEAEAAFDAHVAKCVTCERDADGWLMYPEMCTPGQKILMKWLESD